LLVETDQTMEFDLVVTVATPIPVRVDRLMRSRGLTYSEATSRIRAQATDEERAAIADVVLDGSDPMAALHRQVDEFWSAHVPG
jgi:dephospho-CoA kinase